MLTGSGSYRYREHLSLRRTSLVRVSRYNERKDGSCSKQYCLFHDGRDMASSPRQEKNFWARCLVHSKYHPKRAKRPRNRTSKSLRKGILFTFLPDAHTSLISTCVFITTTLLLDRNVEHPSLWSVLHKAEINLLAFNINARYSNLNKLTQKELRSRRGSIPHSMSLKAPAPRWKMISPDSVSYTHLTLPTIMPG